MKRRRKSLSFAPWSFILWFLACLGAGAIKTGDRLYKVHNETEFMKALMAINGSSLTGKSEIRFLKPMTILQDKVSLREAHSPLLHVSNPFAASVPCLVPVRPVAAERRRDVSERVVGAGGGDDGDGRAAAHHPGRQGGLPCERHALRGESHGDIEP